MRIMLVSSSVAGGGAERVMSNLANALADRGHEVHMLLFFRDEKEYPLSPAVKLSAFSPSKEAYFRTNLLQRTVFLRREIKRIKPELGMGFLEAGYGMFVASLGLRFAKVASQRCNPNTIPNRNSWRGRFNDLWFRSADIVVCQTLGQQRLMGKRRHNDFEIIPNPVANVALEAYERRNYTSCRSFVMLGRISVEKDYPTAIRAFAQVYKRYPDASLTIYGEGYATLKEQLQALAKELAVDEAICFAGWTSAPIEATLSHDAYLLTSKNEGMPNALMEALATGTPCISTDCETGPADLILDGQGGYLVPVGDVDALAERMLQLAAMSEEELAAMGKVARDYMQENFAEKVVVDKWEALFTRLVQERR